MIRPGRIRSSILFDSFIEQAPPEGDIISQFRLMLKSVKKRSVSKFDSADKTVRIKFLVQARPPRVRGRCQMSRNPFEPQPHNLGELFFHKVVYHNYRATVGADRLR